jgi:Trypsin
MILSVRAGPTFVLAVVGSTVLAAGILLGGLPGPAANASARAPVGSGIYIETAPTGSVNGSQIRDPREPRTVAPRIVGGSPTSIGQMPWQVAVAHAPGVAPGNGYDRQFCGGSLVSPTLVVTAAHCLLDDSGRFLPPAAFSAISGRTRLSSTEGRESRLANYYLFTDAQGQPLYDPRNDAWDVVLLELAESARGSPIKIAGPDEAELWSTGRAAYVSGWGATAENGTYPDGLLSAEIAILRDGACTSTFGAGFDVATSFCAGTALGTRDTCSGDSGGPLVVPLATGGFRLAGDTSFGPEKCGSDFPSAYGRLAADPIRSALRNAALDVTSQNIVGSGGRAPTVLTPGQAHENAWIYVEDDCIRWRPCRRYLASPCSALGDGYRCKVTEFAKNRRFGRFRCKQKVLITAASGSIERRGLGRWKCR